MYFFIILGHKLHSIEVITRRTCLLWSWIESSPFAISIFENTEFRTGKNLFHLKLFPYVSSLAHTATNTVKWNRHFVCLWYKMSTFHTDLLPPKNAGSPMTTSIFNTTCESFQMRYCMTFYLKGHQIYQSSKLKLPKKSAFIK